MRTILFLIRKEFIQIFRNKFISRAIFAVPIIQMLILVPAVTFEIKNVRICLVDKDMSSESRALISKLEGSPFFNLPYRTFSDSEAEKLLYSNRCNMVLIIPNGFSRDIISGNPASIMVSINAINSVAAQLSWAYLNGITGEFNKEIFASMAGKQGPVNLQQIQATNRYWYNEKLNYKYYMMPGVLVILVTAIGFLLAGLNMVKEKESGTIEQINVTPVKKYQFITAKMFPFLVIGLIDLALGLGIGKLAFNVPFEGSLFLLFLCASVFLIAVLGLALFVSTFSSSQQQYMFVAFFITIIFILMSGIFTPYESMPAWAQYFNKVNPVAYLIRLNRMVMLKGSTLTDVRTELISLVAIAFFFTLFAVRKYRKTA